MNFDLILVILIALLLVDIYAQQKKEPSGYMRREYSLTKPFNGMGSLQHWEIIGTAVASDDYIRLTPDHQSKQGAVWNIMPLFAQNWEIHLKFKVHGQGTRLFGDGFAFWYTRGRAEIGNVFGGKDPFSGLAVFFDTYSNYNDEHSHEHPYISAQVNNGTLSYDHDRDGTHSEIAGCTSYFRGSESDTSVAMRYLGTEKRLTIHDDVDGEGKWSKCFDVVGIELPTGYYLGLSAATGDLADNHDILGMKFFDLDKEDQGGPGHEETMKIVPKALNAAPYREHVYGPPTSTRTQRAFGWLFALALFGALAAFGGFVFYRKKQRDSAKRFY